VEPDWDHAAPLSLGARLAGIAEIFGALAVIVTVVGLASRWSAGIASFFFG
jgi:hypothetical protein